MPIPTLTSKLDLDALRTECHYSQARLRFDPNAKDLAPRFDPFEPGWLAVSARARALVDAVVDASARIDAGDATLDDLVDQVEALLLVATRKDRAHPLYVSYFNGVAPSVLKRPILGAELTALRGWPVRLSESGVAALAALSADVSAALVEGDAATAALATATQQLEDFWSLREGKQLVDQLNATRADVYGALNQRRHAQPALHLSAAWADGFFRHSPHASTGKLAEVDAQVAQLQAQLQRTLQLQTELRAKADAKAKGAQAQADLAAQAAVAQQAARDATKKANELTAAARKKK